MDWIRKQFSGGPDILRVNPLGIVMMLAGVVISVLAGRISEKFIARGKNLSPNAIKIIAMLICAGGALLAILG